VSVLRPEDLSPQRLAEKIVDALETKSTAIAFDCNGVAKTAEILQDFYQKSLAA
ncbi:MAG: glycosyl transferase, partial [Cyanobacteria bacterium]|nr:glycosyl transferase [Cyanobacteria bacterium GSL.Bin1]